MAAATTLQDFYVGETKRFQITLKLDGAAQNVASDTVRCIVKAAKSDADSEALINVVADVATSGASGIAIFKLTPEHTERLVASTEYYVEVIWTDTSSTPSDRYVAYTDAFTALEPVGDS